jgi:hypothetical protein
MSLHLTEEELLDVTGYRQRRKIADALAEMGIVFKFRAADGFVLVLREHYSAVMAPAGSKKPRRGPDWGAIANGSATHEKQTPTQIRRGAPRFVLVRAAGDQGGPRSERR